MDLICANPSGRQENGKARSCIFVTVNFALWRENVQKSFAQKCLKDPILFRIHSFFFFKYVSVNYQEMTLCLIKDILVIKIDYELNLTSLLS